jgi:hypothetical protein
VSENGIQKKRNMEREGHRKDINREGGEAEKGKWEREGEAVG